MTHVSDLSAPRVRLEASEPRLTPPPARRQFRDALVQTAGVLVRGVESAAGLSPGAPVMAASVRGSALTAPSSAGTTPPTSDLQAALGAHTTSSLELLSLQQEIAAEQRSFMAASNVMKARHDGAKNAIGNVR